MKKKLSELASLIGAKLEGEDLEVSGVTALDLAEETDLSFVETGRFVEAAQKSKAKALIIPPNLLQRLSGKSFLVVPNVRAALAKVAWLFYEEPEHPKGVSSLAFIEEGAEIHEEASIYPFVYVARGAKIKAGAILYPGVYVGQGAEIGEGTVIYPNAVIYPRTKIANNAIVHAGAVIGADGFGYAQEEGKHLKIPHFGRVEIGEEVEIGANTTVDRATFGVTSIGAGSKIDNLVQIAHNVRIGKACVFAGQVGITGSVRIGDFVMMGGQAGVSNHVGERAIVAAKAGIAKEVPPGKAVAGAPAMEIAKWRRCVAAYEKLPDLIKEIRELRARLKELEEKVHDND
ncbi:UDP-3-O-(3-hydroxymyristoyl)glucosamine N-acyltransferase [Thermodesulfatator atlanticus]|uniref:UDP-3-O-(3-hydroxymyristoyl)glucosamine N-acyltransferase n=1 Tax=Thermodesulfatator atlanticus TaxID=501497 RepID=UPI0003B49A33|nr:UDP-3-O-(3-hydroxymyristoyl)glucosamine N-acyltransferase [Thermodesulfatator atlanticus]